MKKKAVKNLKECDTLVVTGNSVGHGFNIGDKIIVIGTHNENGNIYCTNNGLMQEISRKDVELYAPALKKNRR